MTDYTFFCVLIIKALHLISLLKSNLMKNMIFVSFVWQSFLNNFGLSPANIEIHINLNIILCFIFCLNINFLRLIAYVNLNHNRHGYEQSIFHFNLISFFLNIYS